MKKTSISCLVILVSTFIIIQTTASTFTNTQNSMGQKNTDTLEELSLKSKPTDKIISITEQITPTLLLKYLVPIVGYGPRLTGTYGCEKTATYIAQQFDAMNLSVNIQNWTQLTTGHKLTKLKPRILTSQNVEGTLKGSKKDSEKIIIFNAHYDSVKISPGADDDGSGVAAVLAAAEILSQYQFNHTLKFLTFSGEEQGLYGSHAYAKHAYENNDDIFIAFNADMIGHAETSQGGKLFRLYATNDVQYTIDTIIDINTSLNLGFNFHTGALPETGSGGSDYFSFVEYGYEALAFFEGEWNQHMHSLDDTIENMNISYLVNTTKLIVATLAYYADAPISHPQIRIESPQKGQYYLEGKQKKNIKDLKIVVLDDIWIWADVKPGDAPIESVKFYYDGKLKYTDTMYPYKWQCNLRSIRTHTISVVVRDAEGREAQSFSDILFLNPLIRR